MECLLNHSVRLLVAYSDLHPPGLDLGQVEEVRDEPVHSTYGPSDAIYTASQWFPHGAEALVAQHPIEQRHIAVGQRAEEVFNLLPGQPGDAV